MKLVPREALMTRPTTEAEYLASMVPASVSGTVMGRRALFKTAAAQVTDIP